jgi:integration host factor subunit alpha
MSGNTVTRADLSEAIHQKIGLSQTECATLVELVLKEIKDCLERGETVKLSSFGVFVVRKKGQRMGRNPKTGEEATTHPAASSRSSRPRSLRSGSIPLVHDLREKHRTVAYLVTAGRPSFTEKDCIAHFARFCFQRVND